jgi:hypothetical protein
MNKGVSIAVGLALALTIGCSCRQETHLPAPDAPEAPKFVPPAEKPAEKPAKAERPKVAERPSLSSFPASREPPIYGLPLEIKITPPEPPTEIVEPSPPRDEKKAKS